MRWWPALTATLLAGCFTKPPRPGGDCGNGAVEPDMGERCDDGGLAGGDGCSDQCEIEPWFQCPTAGEPCLPIVALQWTGAGNTLPRIGTPGGVDFDDECGTLAGINGPNTVIVGIEGETEASTMDSIVEVRAHCADIELRSDGTIRWQTTSLTPPRGSTGGTGDLQLRRCDADEVVTGFDGNAGNFVSAIELFCQAVTHDDGKLRFGVPRKLAPLGPGNQIGQAEAPCGTNEVARAIVGKSGAVIDEFTLRCVPTEPVICGDNITNTEFETCDDGNAISGDGCNARCDGD